MHRLAIPKNFYKDFTLSQIQYKHIHSPCLPSLSISIRSLTTTKILYPLIPLSIIGTSTYPPSMLSNSIPISSLLTIHSSRRLFSITPSPPPSPRPKAQLQSPKSIQQKETYLFIYSIIFISLSIIIPIAYIMINEQLSFTEVLDYLIEQIIEMGELEDNDVRSVLPIIQQNRNNNNTNSNTNNKPVSNSKIPVATIIMGWEGTLVDMIYHPKAGLMAIPRPGLDKFLLTCSNHSIELIIWSKEYTSTTVQDQLKHIIQGMIIPQDKQRYDLFNEQLNYHYKEAKALELAMAYKEKRSVRNLPHIDNNERPNYYIKNMLNISAILGKDHCQTRYLPPKTIPSSSSSLFSSLYNKIHYSTLIRPYHLLMEQRLRTNPVIIMDNDTTKISTTTTSSNERNDNSYILTIGTWKSPDSTNDKQQKDMYLNDPTLLLFSALFERYNTWKLEQEQLNDKNNTKSKNQSSWFGGKSFSTVKSSSLSMNDAPTSTINQNTIINYINDVLERSKINKLKPSTGLPIDNTVGILGMILMDIEKEEKSGPQGG